MVEKNNATCSICGKGYHMCLSCKDEMKSKPWKLHTCSSEHYKIFSIVKGYSFGVYNKSEAKKRLQKVDLSDFDSLRENIKNIINEIMEPSKKTKASVETEEDKQQENEDEEPKVEPVEETQEEPVEELSVEDGSSVEEQ